ncbi:MULTISPECIES: TetR/AcrR family transcriptional regulator [Mumia]|uniref:TetR/AcrR family transcriptional regulator n=1 Tax=Mumia TaxID=1546255 RepID=UPI001422CF3E|nr:TetR/AcrR family transcriptional regulator [Mumia sp. ZJ1417]QMW67252.1 TetR/AcrR family transcriptional regulator [Mumia sp. ZJ1417]
MRVSSQQRREQLIEAALVVAKRDGVGAVSTRTVAAEAGATPGIVHYVFASMDELLRAMIGRMAEQYIDTVTDAAVAGEHDATSLLVQSFTQLWNSVEDDPDGHLLTFEVAAHALRNAGFNDLAQWQYATYRETAKRVLERVAEVCDVEWTLPLDVLARMLVVINDGVVLSWLVDRDSEKAREVYAAFVREVASYASPRRETAG